MFNVRLAKALQACGGNALGQPQETRLHIRRKCGNLCGDHFVEDFNPPRHRSLYLIFEICTRRDWDGAHHAGEPICC
jgi:hypothetical protein